MFSVRNAGNLIPHAQHFQDEHYSCEPAALELGCVVNDIRHIIVCGHSDCKAMNLLYELRDPDFASKVTMRRLYVYAKATVLDTYRPFHCSVIAVCRH